MRPLFLLFLFVRGLPLFAQNPDSLMNAAGSYPAKDPKKVDLLNEAGTAFWKSGNDSMAIACYHEAIRAAAVIPYPKGAIEARLQLVVMEMEYLSDLETAYSHLDSALSAAKRINDRSLEAQAHFRRAQLYSLGIWEHSGKVRPLYDSALVIFKELGDGVREGMVYTQLAALESDEGRFARAIEYLLQARVLQEQSGDTRSLRATIPNLGVMYMNIGLFDQALRCFDEAEKNAVGMKDERVLAFLSGQRGELYLKRGLPERALRELEKAESGLRKLGGVQFLTGTYARMGEAHLQLGDTGKAFYYAAKADSLFKAVTDGADLLSHSARIVLGNVALRKGQYRQVIPMAREGLEWAEEARPALRKEAMEYHRQLAAALEETGEPGRALMHHKQFKVLSDSLLNAEVIQRAMASSMEYEFEKKRREDQLRIQALENQNLVRTRNLSLALLVLGVVALAYAVWANGRLRQKNQALVRKNEEIEQALYKGQHIERKRVASELHDGLNTKIAGIRWHLESLESNDFSDHNRRIVRQLLDITGEAYDDIRLISHNMVPAELEKNGLVAALQRLVSRAEAANKEKLKLHAGLQERLSAGIERQLYYITLELVNNVIRHAGASEVTISLEQAGDRVELTVADNGKGFSGTPGDGVGLTNVRSRVASLGGTCRMRNGDKGGAVVSITVPVRAQ